MLVFPLSIDRLKRESMSSETVYCCEKWKQYILIIESYLNIKD